MKHLEITPHDVSPEAAISAIQNHSGPILLDLDETLYLRNSTEDFIDTARPRLLVLFMLRLLDLIKPWRWTGGESTRDVWRVRAISIAFPWVQSHWKRRVHWLAKRFANFPLLAVVKSPGTIPIIATAGFRPIVTPLVAALGLPQAQIVAARLSSFTDRRNGKLQLTIGALGGDTICRALVLTDSAQDITLLDACARPLRTVWPEALRQRALSSVYVPGLYLTRVKRPGSRYIVRSILQEDFVFFALSSVALAGFPLFHIIGLFFLFISFWTIYERGYVDNDLIAARYEADPKLSASFHDSPVSIPRWQPWIWAITSGVLAIFVLRWPETPPPTDYAVWIAVLLATHFWFMLYNRFDKRTRVWFYAGLQFSRTAAFVALVPICLIGVAALGAHILAKWIPYYIYRHSGKDWQDAPYSLMRLLFFVILALLIGFSSDTTALLNGTTVALLAWNIYRARKELLTVFTDATRIDKNEIKPPI